MGGREILENLDPAFITLYKFWESEIREASKKNPKSCVVSDSDGDFDE